MGDRGTAPVLLTLLALLACATCEHPRACPQGRCLYAEVVAAPDVAAVHAGVRALSDPIVRNAAVLSWAERNHGRVSTADAERVCALLDAPQEARACVRKLMAAHLQ